MYIGGLQPLFVPQTGLKTIHTSADWSHRVDAGEKTKQHYCDTQPQKHGNTQRYISESIDLLGTCRA